MKIAVTGANGLVGSHLCGFLESGGHKVVRLRRGASNIDEFDFDLNQVPASGIFAGCDALVHCAYDFKAVHWNAIKRTNVQGSLALIDAAKKAGIRRIIFMSTISAFDGCKSNYGRGKLLVEKAVRAHNGVVIRPGLIYGDPGGRGMFGALARLCWLPLLPVFSGGDQLLYPVHIDDISAFVKDVVERFDEICGQILYAASSEPITFRSLLGAIAAENSSRGVRFVSIPGSAAVAALRLAELAGLSIGFTSDNLVGLLNFDPAPAVTRNYLKFKFREFSSRP